MQSETVLHLKPGVTVDRIPTFRPVDDADTGRQQSVFTTAALHLPYSAQHIELYA